MVQGHAGSVALRIRPARRVAGTIRVPGDKSISHRYLMLAAIAKGATTISNLGPGADVAATAACLRDLGVTIDTIRADLVRVDGRGWDGLRTPSAPLNAANSGTTIRLLAGLLAGRPLTAVLTGDASLSRRPMARVIDPLIAMGGDIEAPEGRAPLIVRGRSLHGIRWRPPIASAQVKSAIMLAALSATGSSTIDEPLATRDHTERAFPLFGLTAAVAGPSITVAGGQTACAPGGGTLRVPGDPSSAAPLAAAAAALPGSAVEILDVCLNPRRLGFVRALRAMGAAVDIMQTDEVGGEPVGRIAVRHQDRHWHRIGPADVPDLIDELPVLAACAALGGGLEVTGASELRVKESDRIASLVAGFRALGVEIEELPDGFLVHGARQPSGGSVDAAGDHRLVMAFAIVALGSRADSFLTGAGAVAVSYPDFAAVLAGLTE